MIGTTISPKNAPIPSIMLMFSSVYPAFNNIGGMYVNPAHALIDYSFSDVAIQQITLIVQGHPTWMTYLEKSYLM
jgi:hypothetical protein